jgi:outer membrane protein assembly factor BamB
MARRLASQDSPYKGQTTGTQATITYGDEATNARAVTVQLKDDRGTNVAVKTAVRFYLSEAAGGDAIVTTAPSGGIAVGASGKVLVVNTAGKDLFCLTDATGKLILTVTESTAKSFHVNVVLPTGELVNGATLTFA